MTIPWRAFARSALTPILLVLALVMAGCASENSPRDQARKDSPKKAPLPTLVGQETFFDGQILAELKVGAMTGFNPEGEAKGGEGDGAGKRRDHDGGGGF